MKFMTGAFQNLRVHEALARATLLETQPPLASSNDGRASPTATTAGVSASPATATAVWLAQRGAGRRSPRGIVPAERWSQKIPPIQVKFDGKLQQLGFFLTHVLTFMQEYGPDLPTEGAQIKCITLPLEGAAVCWMITLHNENAPNLRNFNCFMGALHQCFEAHWLTVKRGIASKLSARARGRW